MQSETREAASRLWENDRGGDASRSYTAGDGKLSSTTANVSTKSMGLVVNPIAGMGGAVGLKGTDGQAILQRARLLGAEPVAPVKAGIFLSELAPIKSRLRLFVGAGEMGEAAARVGGFIYTVFGARKAETVPQDTVETAERIRDADADLLVFCGGDGTARDVLRAVGYTLPVLGVPTGVKMHSAVFAVHPRAAARIAMEFLWGELPLREAEVMDVDEKAFRAGRVSARLYGSVLTPYEPFLSQGVKLASPTTESELRNQAAIAVHIIENMEADVAYIIGPGTTTRAVGVLLDAKKTLLGVDVFLNKQLVSLDATEQEILQRIAGKRAKIVVTPIGGQGFLFGRGNQQISPNVIRQVGVENIVVVATEHKLRALHCLRVDTGDAKLDAALRGPVEVLSDYHTRRTRHIE